MQPVQKDTAHNSSRPDRNTIEYRARRYNERSCPSCGTTIFGMPGGRDAHCAICGYKDPCCSD